MCHQNLADIPDDPYRVAPPYCAPGEIEPPDAPQVSDAEAVARVLAVLQDQTDVAFGKDAHWWQEILLDALYGEDARSLVIGVLGLMTVGNYGRRLGLLCTALEHHVGDTANNLLTEMPPDELEREGF